MTRDATRQPDQDPALWDRHVAAYEAVFEPLTDAFAARALDALEPLEGARLLDVCAGPGGAALLAAARGACGGRAAGRVTGETSPPPERNGSIEINRRRAACPKPRPPSRSSARCRSPAARRRG